MSDLLACHTQLAVRHGSSQQRPCGGLHIVSPGTRAGPGGSEGNRGVPTLPNRWALHLESDPLAKKWTGSGCMASLETLCNDACTLQAVAAQVFVLSWTATLLFCSAAWSIIHLECNMPLCTQSVHQADSTDPSCRLKDHCSVIVTGHIAPR